MEMKAIIALGLAAALSVPFLSSCGEKEDDVKKGSTYEELWGKKDDKDEDKPSGTIEGYVREVEKAEDTYVYPEAGAETYYKPSLNSTKYKPFQVDYYAGSCKTAGQVPSWTKGTVRIVHYMTGYEPETKTYEKYKTLTNKWGSTLTMERQEATGRFYVKQIDGRWWIIDPEGYVSYMRGVTSFRHGSSSRNAKAFKERFQDNDQVWITTSQKELAEVGIHATGAFCTDAYGPMVTYNKSHDAAPLVLCPSFGFLSKFRSANYSGKWPGGNENLKAAFALDEKWGSWCQTYLAGSEFSNYRGNKYVFGFFSDNEIPFNQSLLKDLLNVTDTSDPFRQKAVEWMKSKGVSNPASGSVTTALAQEFIGHVADCYYKGVREAVDLADKKLMYVGTRLHGSPKYIQSVVEAAGRYCDIVSINYYSRWDVELDTKVKDWNTWAKRPFMVTEFYTKGVEDSWKDWEIPNTSGAGWCVRTQADRAYCYQHFTLGLLEAKNCVGWTWFKYQDDDGSDNSNCPANKGLYDNAYLQYPILAKFMKEVNFNVYDLINYFDGKLK